jgi:hypothetical protein
MPIQQTKRFSFESVVRLTMRPRQSANLLSRQLGARENPVTPGHAGGPVGLGYSGRTTPSRLDSVSSADRAITSAARLALSFPLAALCSLKHGHLDSN